MALPHQSRPQILRAPLAALFNTRITESLTYSMYVSSMTTSVVTVLSVLTVGVLLPLKALVPSTLNFLDF
jgi:hypothetical protein